MTDETLSVLRTRYNKNEHSEQWLTDRQSLIAGWFADGHFMGESSFGDWWLYRKDHQPGDARVLQGHTVGAAMCRLLRKQEIFIKDSYDGFARVMFYTMNTQKQG